MARRKKQQDILDRLMSNFSLRGILLHQATLFVAASCLVIGGVIFLWKNNQASIVNEDEYLLTADKIVIPEPPPWVDIDPREMILDQIHSVSKSKSGIKIDLDYRQPVPVAVVVIDHKTMPGVIDQGTEIKLAVDRNGTVMPKQLSQTPMLPIISMAYPVKRQTQLNTWADWPDERVRAAAKICQYFKGNEQNVYRVVTFQKPGQLKQEQPFELWSKSGVHGTRIIWGVESDSQGGNEANVQQKLAAIESLIARIGKLSVPKRLNPSLGRVFDVRTGKAIELPLDKVATMPKVKF